MVIMPLDHSSRSDNSILTAASLCLGVTSNAVYKYCVGLQYPTLATVRRIEQEFHWSVSEQIRLMPLVPGEYDQGYGMVLMEVLRDHFADTIDDQDFPPAEPPKSVVSDRPKTRPGPQMRRGAGGWTHAYAGERVGVKSHAMSRWLNGTRYPEVRAMLRLEKLTGWPATEQIVLVPLEGYDERYGTALRAALDRTFPVKRKV